MTEIKEWARYHPWQALARAAWLVLNFSFWGGAAAVLAWGPLAGRPLLILTLGIVGGLVPTLFWARQQRAAIAGDREAARRWRRALVGGAGALFCAIALVALAQLYQAGTIAPPARDRVASFDRLWRAMDAHYPYFESKGIDWDEIYARYHPRVEQVQSDEEYHRLVETMLAELDDTHTYLTPSLAAATGCHFAATQEMAGQAVVTVVRRSGQQLGLELGALILTIDGQPVQQAVEAVDPRLCTASTPWGRRVDAFQRLLHTPLGTSREVTFETAAGDQVTAALSCTQQVAGLESGGADAWDLLLPMFNREIVSRRLPSGIGYIRVPTFGTDLVADFDAALDALIDAPALVIDLRGNGGGTSLYADRMAGRFLDEPFVYGRDYFAGRLPLRAWRPYYVYKVAPRQPVYTGPVVVIVEAANTSSAEQFLVSLVDSGRAYVVGQRTGGASGNPLSFGLPGERTVYFSTADFRRNDGTSIEGVGIVPDVEVTWTVDDMRQGRDPDLQAAEQLLFQSLAHTAHP